MKLKIGLVFFIFLKFLVGQELYLSNEELIKLTLENNLMIKSYQEKFNQAKLKEQEIIFGILPQIKLTGRYSRLREIEPFIIQLPFAPGSPRLVIYEPEEEQYFTRVSLDFPLFTGLRQINSIKAQKKFSSASEEELKNITSEIVFKAKELYFKLFLAYKSLRLIEANLEFLEGQRRTAQNFFENGLLHENDVLKIDLALTQAKIKFFDQQNVINNLNLALCQTLNLNLGTRIIPTFELDKILEENLIEVKKIERPEIVALKNMISANKYLERVAYGSVLPSLFINAGYDYAKPNPKYFPVRNEWKYSWDVNLVLQFTLWDWLLPINRSKQIDLQIKQMEYQLKQLIVKSEIERANLYDRIENEKMKKTLYEMELKFANENFRITENKFKEGLVNTTDLLDANRQKVEAETKLLESKVNLILLKEEMKKISGLY